MIKFVLPRVVQFQGQILKYFFSSNFYHLYYTRLSFRCLYVIASEHTSLSTIANEITGTG